MVTLSEGTRFQKKAAEEVQLFYFYVVHLRALKTRVFDVRCPPMVDSAASFAVVNAAVVESIPAWRGWNTKVRVSD